MHRLVALPEFLAQEEKVRHFPNEGLDIMIRTNIHPRIEKKYILLLSVSISWTPKKWSMEFIVHTF